MAENSEDPFKDFTDEISLPHTEEEKIEYCNSYGEKNDIESLVNSMKKYDETNINTQIVRQRLANKLLNDVMKMDLAVTAATDPDLFAAESKMISEARGLLNDIDNSSKNHVATKLKRKDSDTQASMAFNAAELLTKISISLKPQDASPVVSSDEINQMIESQFDDPGTVVLDSELEVGNNKLPQPSKKEDE